MMPAHSEAVGSQSVVHKTITPCVSDVRCDNAVVGREGERAVRCSTSSGYDHGGACRSVSLFSRSPVYFSCLILPPTSTHPHPHMHTHTHTHHPRFHVGLHTEISGGIPGTQRLRLSRDSHGVDSCGQHAGSRAEQPGDQRE